MMDAVRPVTLSEIAELSDVNASQAHTYLTSLRRFGLVEQDDALGRYGLGPCAMQLVVGSIRGAHWQQSCLTAVSDLSIELGMMVTLVAWGARGPTVIQIYDGGSNLNLSMRSGMVFSMTGTASGRMFAAFGQSDDIQNLIAAEMTRSKSSPFEADKIEPAQFQAELQKIRKDGAAWAVGKPIPNVNAVCVPVFAPNGDIRFSMSVVGSAENLPESEDCPPLIRLREVVEDVMALAREEESWRAE